MTDLLAEATSELYERDPEDFTTRRATFAAQAREAGESDVAKKISALRKPTRSAWVVNHLVRADPDVTGRLADLSGELQQAVSADGARIRELTAARAKLVDDLTQQALKAARLASPPAALREEVTATLDAAIADPEVAGRLGSLVRAERYAGFGPVAPGAAPPPPAKKTAKSTPPADAAEDRARRRQEKIETAERALAQADHDLESALSVEHDTEDAVRKLEAELADARQRLAEARRQSYRAESRQRKASAQLDRIRE
ncbi:MAG: hypothetical protein WAK82_41915 [Streptosporangiaceae bacterium]